MHASIYVCMYIPMYVCVYIHTYVSVCVCACTYIPMCVYVCVCVYNSIITQVHTTWDDIGIEMVEEYDATTDQLLLRKVLLVHETFSY